jgi:putative transposase
VSAHIRRVWHDNRQVYGVRKIWKQLMCEGYPVARGTVALLMKRLDESSVGSTGDSYDCE